MEQRFWSKYHSWEEAELRWETQAEEAKRASPLKGLVKMPSMVGITEETKRHLKWKSLKWIWQEDHEHKIRKGFLKHPFKYCWRLLQSLWRPLPYRQEGDHFYYGTDFAAFKKALTDPRALFVLGFSYCHKPFECPSGRFTDACQHDQTNPVCQQCFIGKSVHAAPPKTTIPLFIPTVHYIGAKIFELIEKHPKRPILFLITACEMTLRMFGDLGNMVDIRGIGIRLGGRICNTMRAFELSERGIKPGLTTVSPEAQRSILTLLQHRARFCLPSEDLPCYTQSRSF